MSSAGAVVGAFVCVFVIVIICLAGFFMRPYNPYINGRTMLNPYRNGALGPGPIVPPIVPPPMGPPPVHNYKYTPGPRYM